MTRTEYMRKWRAAHPDYAKNHNPEARREYMRKYMRKYRAKDKPVAKSMPCIAERPGWPTREQLMAGR